MRVFKRVTAILSAVLMFVAMLVPVSAFALSGNISPGNRVYFYNMSGNGAASSDFIIVESRGHWGLIDTGHRYKNSISDSDGRNYPAYQANGLSSQVKDKYGLAAVQYMVSTLGVNHLDFVIGTHSHSDHIGGVPEIAAYAFKGSDGKAKHLVDNNTVYFYKQYHHVNNEQDDIVMPSAGSWHNQAFAYQANLAMQQQGCVMVDVSNGLFVNGSSQKNNNYVEVTEAINHVNGLSSAVYSEGAFNNYYDDNITFAFGDMTISLYNLFKHRTSIDENVNSIVATILYNNHTLVSLSDINVENRAEQCVSKAIRSRYGTVDVMKAAHHGVTRGSNSKETIDLLQPKTVIATRGIDDVYSSQAPGAYANVLSYAKSKYGTVFYEVGASDRALVVDMTDIKLYSLGGVGSSVRLNGALQCINHMTIANGWSNWDRCWDNSLFQRDIFYFQDESYRTGWIKWQGQWYLLAYADGVMLTGWQWVGNNWYYLIESQEIADDYGAAVVGWKYINGYWYYFDEQNAMKVGWIKTGGYWYYLNYSGAMQTGWYQSSAGNWYYFTPATISGYPKGAALKGWQMIGGKWYYFAKTASSEHAICSMYKGWQEIGGNWYYFDGSGAMQTGWIGSNENGWFYADENGVMQTGWQKIDGYWYYFVPAADGTYKLGQMVKGSYTINGKTYVFNSNGTAFSGLWNGVYYNNGSPIENGWTTINGHYVYLKNGSLLKNTWLYDDGKWYYLNADGSMKQNEWFQYTDKDGDTGWYYLQDNGSAATGEHRIGGKNYRFNFNGFMLKEEAPAASSSTYVNYYDTSYTYWSPFHNAYQKYRLHRIGNQYAYCLQFNRPSRTGSKTATSLEDSDAWKSLSYAAKIGITRATLVGYPNYDLGVSNAEAAAAATAMVIHEYQMNYRTYCGTDSPRTGLDSSVSNSDVLCNMAAREDGDLWIAYRNITRNIANFNVKPSFAGHTYTVKENSNGTYSYTLTDTKGVLKDYVVAYTTNDNLTAEISGNQLTVTSASKLNAVNVVLSKKGTTASTQKYGSAVALFDNSNYQTLVFGSVHEASDASIWFNFEEDVVYGSLEITKINESKEPLAGAKFSLVNNATGNVYATLTTNASGKATLNNIPVGKYTLKETQAPSEYHLTSEKREFEVKKNSNNSFKYTIVNSKEEERVQGCVYIFKQNADTRKVMTGAEFSIYADEDIYKYANLSAENNEIAYHRGDLVVPMVTISADGFAMSPRLYIGKYYAIETKAPQGFKINPEKQYFEIKENTREFTAIPSVTLDAANTYDDVAGVYEYGSVTVNVENAASASDKVAGAIINAYYLNGDGEDILVGTAVTDENGSAVFNNIAYGLEYTFVQAKNMNTSYLASAEEYAITLDNEKTSDTVTFKNALSPDASVIEAVTMLSVFDEPFSVTLFKKDKETLQGLSGAIINVYNADGDTVYSGKTDENGAFTIKGIPAGEYSFEEIQAPDGYVLNTLVQSFTVAEDGTVSGDDTVLNEKTVVTLHKTDLTTAEGVPGATIVITDTDGEAVFEDITDADGDITVTGLNPGTYYFKETVAPSGYIKNTTVFEFTLNRDGTIEGDDTITNQPTAVVIQKFAEDTNLPQPNAEFEFFNSDGESIGKFLTNEDGEIAFSKLPIGSYTYKETRAPEGYALNTTVFAFTINEDGTVTGDTTVVDMPITVIIQKVEKGTDKPLKDAEFEFFNSEGESIGKFVTNDDGEIILTKLPVGAYTYKETKAPEGYVLDDKTVYSFEIAEDGTVTGTLKVENEEEPKFKMPKTGAQGLLLMGGLAIGCFLVSIFISKKKKNTAGETDE